MTPAPTITGRPREPRIALLLDRREERVDVDVEDDAAVAASAAASETAPHALQSGRARGAAPVRSLPPRRTPPVARVPSVRCGGEERVVRPIRRRGGSERVSSFGHHPSSVTESSHHTRSAPWSWS